MSDCNMFQQCPFFKENMKDMPDHTALFKQLYCHGGNDLCARYMIARKLGPDAVPTGLFPNEVTRANILIADAMKKAGA